MRLTEILNALFESNGEEIFIGETKLDGIIIDREGDGIVATTVASEIDAANLRITYDTNNPIVGSSARLVATAKIEFDSYEWSIDGTASFVGGVNTGPMVYITDSELSNNIITLTATAGEITKIVQMPLNFVNGFFGSAEIIGINTIDYTDPVKYSISSTPMPDAVSWSIEGDAIVSSGGSIYETFVTIGESGEDVELVATISKEGFVDKTIRKPIAVAKCEIASGGATVERPVIMMDDGWEIDKQGLVKVSNFHGINNPSLIEYQIDEAGGIFDSPILSNQVEYSSEFSIDTTQLLDGNVYLIRVKFIDDIGNESKWSDTVQFSSHTGIEYIDGIDEKVRMPLDGSSIDEISETDIPWRGSPAFFSTIFGKSAHFDGSNALDFSGTDLSDIKCISMFVRWDGVRGVDNWATFIGSKSINETSNNIKLAVYQGKLVTWQEPGDQQTIYDGVEKNVWMHVAVKEVDSGIYNYYINGELAAENLSDNNATLDIYFIGSDNENGDIGESFTGEISKLRLIRNDVDDDTIRRIFLNDKPDITRTVSHYWAMNTQNPKDLVGTSDFVTNYCAVVNGGTYDNFLRFNGSTSKITNAYSILPGANTFAARVRFNSLSSDYPFILGQNTVFEFGIDHNQLVAYTGNGSSWNDEVESGFYVQTGVMYDIVVATRPGLIKMYVDGVLVYTKNDPGITGTNSGFMGVGKRDDNSWDFLNGEIEEIAIWEGMFLSDRDIVEWHNKEDRPFGGEKLKAVPCAAIDRPVILNNEGPNIQATKYYGINDFNKTEYQLFRDVELEYANPVFQELVYVSEDIPISTTVEDDTYKVRVRYKDISNNVSPWSRIKFFNFIKSTYDILDIFGDNSSVFLLNLNGDLSFQGEQSAIVSKLGSSFASTAKGQALKVEGNNSYVKIESLPLLGVFTMSIIVYYDNSKTSSYPGLIGQVDTPIKSLRVSHNNSDGPNIWTDGNDHVISSINSTSYNGHWALWTFAYDGEKYILDINNGEQSGELTGESFDTTKIVLGCQLENGEGIVGYVKQFRLFNRILTSEEKGKLLLEMNQF